MSTIQSDRSDKSQMGIFTGIILGIAILLSPGIVFGLDFRGSEHCQQCHEEEYSDWKVSGHPYKLMKSEEARNRPIPLPLGFSWEDISYVIGGYKWKSRYIDNDGYIITVTDNGNVDGVNQYNNMTGEWVSYHAGEVDKPYDCGTCHTTNWVENPDPTNLDENQGNLPGMHGKFDVGGIHCEQCHGNDGGEDHMTGTDRIDKSAEACGVCHHRTSPPGSEVNSIPAGGGFVRHHEQYNELLASPHDNFNCVSCHNPHKRSEFSIVTQCNACHGAIEQTYATTPMADYGVECKDCHMPYASKSANLLGEFEGDLQTHIFYINTDPDASMFNAAGDFVALDDEGKAAVTMDFACKRCHETAEMDELAKFAKNFHGLERDEGGNLLEPNHYTGLTPGLSGHWYDSANRSGEGFLIDFSFSQGSLVIIATFYTYDDMGNQVWLLATGPAANGTTAEVNVYITEGRMWGDDFNPDDGEELDWGTATFTFPSCLAGSFTLTPNAAMIAQGFTEIGYDLKRDASRNALQCPTFVNDAP